MIGAPLHTFILCNSPFVSNFLNRKDNPSVHIMKKVRGQWVSLPNPSQWRNLYVSSKRTSASSMCQRYPFLPIFYFFMTCVSTSSIFHQLPCKVTRFCFLCFFVSPFSIFKFKIQIQKHKLRFVQVPGYADFVV